MGDVSSHERTFADPARPAAWAATGWLLVVALTSAAVGMLSLPGPSTQLSESVTGRDLFHAEWLVLGTLIAYFVSRLAYASMLLGALGVVLTSAEMILVVDTAADRFRDSNLVMAMPEFWYAVAFSQSLIFLDAGISGARRRLTERQWQELVHRITVEPAASVAAPGARFNSRARPGRKTRADP
jgi:hypothetical protein